MKTISVKTFYLPPEKIDSVDDACLEAGLMCDFSGIHCQTDEDFIDESILEYMEGVNISRESLRENRVRNYEERVY